MCDKILAIGRLSRRFTEEEFYDAVLTYQLQQDAELGLIELNGEKYILQNSMFNYLYASENTGKFKAGTFVGLIHVKFIMRLKSNFDMEIEGFKKETNGNNTLFDIDYNVYTEYAQGGGGYMSKINTVWVDSEVGQQLKFAVPESGMNEPSVDVVGEIEKEILEMYEYARGLHSRHEFTVDQILDYVSKTTKDIFYKYL